MTSTPRTARLAPVHDECRRLRLASAPGGCDPLHVTFAAGECHRLHLAAGSRWTAAAGRVRLGGPLRELAGLAVAIDRVLAEGESEVLDAGGWVTVQALAASVLVVEPAAPRALHRWRGWRGGWRWFRPWSTPAG